jgi:hypothetical protein
MKPIATVLLFFLTQALLAQETFIVNTDSSKIVTKFYPGGKEVRENIKKRNLVYYTFYKNNNGIITSTAFYDTLGRYIGISKEFDDGGKLLYTIDHDKGIWNVSNKNDYPFYELQNKFKLKADSLVTAMYSKEFLEKNAIWNVVFSYLSNHNESGNWTNKLKSKPTKFMFRYNVRFDKDRIYDNLIEFELDSLGNFIPNQYERVFGFEEMPTNVNQGFRLTYDKAIILAKQNGLTQKDSARTEAFLVWKGFEKPQLYNGKFLFYIAIETGVEEEVDGWESIQTKKYDVYVFNPWTCEFIEKKKMKRVSYYDYAVGYSAELEDDK